MVAATRLKGGNEQQLSFRPIDCAETPESQNRNRCRRRGLRGRHPRQVPPQRVARVDRGTDGAAVAILGIDKRTAARGLDRLARSI